MEARAGASKAAGKTTQSNTTIPLRKTDNAFLFPKDGVFPPTIFSDVIYSKGIRLFPESIREDSQNVSLSYSYDYTAPLTAETKKSLKVKVSRNSSFPNVTNSVPLLNSQDALLWSHKRAAKSAAEQHWPMPIFRLLGVISREVFVTDNDSPLNTYSLAPDFPAALKVKKQSRMSMKAAMSEAMAEGLDQDLQARASTIHVQWTKKMDQGPMHSGWDQYGQLPKEAVNDGQYVPLFHLWDWLKRRNVVETSHKSLYNGLRLIPTDLQTVVASLMELSYPTELYKIPLILPYAVMDIVDEKSFVGYDSRRKKPVHKKRRIDSTGRQWRIRIGVYANRLLPEVMTSHDLHNIMTALDQGSYRTLEPLHIPPSPKERVFESSPTPIVVTDDFGDVSDSLSEEKKSDDVVDATFGDSTRDESRISAFSVKGFLQLLENEGNDISNVSQPLSYSTLIVTYWSLISCFCVDAVANY
jgi:muconolactone delta-isomerase